MAGVEVTDAEQQTDLHQMEACSGSCPICLEDIRARDGSAMVACGSCANMFHSKCYFNLHKTSPSQTGDCPVCRQAFDGSSLSSDWDTLPFHSHLPAEMIWQDLQDYVDEILQRGRRTIQAQPSPRTLPGRDRPQSQSHRRADARPPWGSSTNSQAHGRQDAERRHREWVRRSHDHHGSWF